jgi:protein-S-isoprenylcysteine O-methyltransferase Ste14
LRRSVEDNLCSTDCAQGDEARRPNRSMLKKILRWTDLIACLVLIALAVRFGPRTAIWYTGLLLSAISLPLWVVARRQLGTSFSAMPEARHLVTHGLYSKMRHPIYVFGSLAYFGSLLALQVWPILVAWLALTPIEVVRARREDRVLANAFGPDYAAYRSKTWL